MDLIEFIIKHRDCLNIRGIEHKLEIPEYFLRDVLASKRLLPSSYGDRLISYFGEYGVRLDHAETRKRSIKVDTWDLAIHHRSTVGGYRLVSGHAQKPVMRNGKMMVRV